MHNSATLCCEVDVCSGIQPNAPINVKAEGRGEGRV